MTDKEIKIPEFKKIVKIDRTKLHWDRVTKEDVVICSRCNAMLILEEKKDEPKWLGMSTYHYKDPQAGTIKEDK